MAKKNPWDDVIQFDDWNTQVKEEIQEEIPTEETVNNSAPKEVQGIGLVDDDDDIDLSNMIANLNAGNASYVEKAKQEEKEMLDEQRQAQEEAIRLQREQKLREQFEIESAERDRIAFEEAQALAEAVRQKQEKSLVNKANKLFGLNKPKKKKKQEEQEEDVDVQINDESAEDGQEEISEQSNDQEEVTEATESESQPELEPEPEVVPPVVAHDKEAFKPAKEISVKRKKRRAEQSKDEDEEEDSNVEPESIPESTAVEETVQVEEEPKNKKLRKKGKTDQEPKEEPIEEKTEEAQELSNQAEASEIPEKLEKPEKPEKKEKKGFFSFGKKKPKAEDSEPSKKESNEDSDSDSSANSKPNWEYLATHDELTGLFNQRAYEEDKQKERKKPYAVVFVDVNNLKYANDNFGHAAGNKLIIAVADEMKKLFPECAYRIGGDEFVAIWECNSVKKIEKDMESIQSKFHEAMEKKTKAEEEYALIYSASFGYSYTDGSKSFKEVSDEADKAMYSAKDAYKKAHPQLDMRGGGAKPKKKKEQEQPKEYDELLSKEQRALKQTIKGNHRPVSVDSTQQIIMDVQAKASEVIAILIASPTFDQLFIIHDPNTFIGIVMEMESMIDYSYLYILYEGGPQYKGSDEYLSEVTHIFEAIGNGIKSGRIRSEKDIQKIKGINVFKKIFVDM